MQESSLHHALKDLYCGSNCRLEAWVDGYQVDVQCGERIIEIQTGSFYKLKGKLAALLTNHPVTLVYPIPAEKWICRIHGDQVQRRRSPKRGRFEDLYAELIGIPDLLAHENLSLEVVFVQVEEFWKDDGQGSWRRRGWSIVERRLIGIQDHILITSPDDLRQRLPPDLDGQFTVRELALKAKIKVRLAAKMAYCLNIMGVFEIAGKRGRARLFTRTS